MELLFWGIIIISFILGFVGLIVPVLPSVIMFWVGFLVYHFGINNTTLSWMFWVIMIVLTLLVLFSEVIANSYFVNRFGGTKEGEYAAIVGSIIGMFVYPPLGIILVPFILVILVELVMKRDFNQALNASIGSLLAFVSSSIFKFLVYVFMVFFFFLDAFVF